MNGGIIFHDESVMNLLGLDLDHFRHKALLFPARSISYYFTKYSPNEWGIIFHDESVMNLLGLDLDHFHHKALLYPARSISYYFTKYSPNE
jgi:hypothetical protein